MKSTFETLGDRLKDYEAKWERSIDVNEHIVIRIDGHKFSKFTKGFKRPYDEILSRAMEQTTKDLLKEFNAVVGYTQSDEISLIITRPASKKVHYNKKPSQDINNLNHAYNGRIQKIASLASAFATMAFNRALTSLYEEQKTLERDLDQVHDFEYRVAFGKYMDIFESKIGNAWFDARVYSVDSDIEAFNSILWRCRDAEKNSRSMFAQNFCKSRDLQNMNGREQVDFCLKETGNDWEKVDDRYKYGMIIKKRKYNKLIRGEDVNRFCGTVTGTVERTEIYSFSKHLTFSDDNVNLIMEKFTSS